MRYINLQLLLMVLIAVVATGCQHEFPGGFDIDSTLPESESVVTLNSARTDGIISLSVDAPAQARFNVWIDLNSDGERAADGSENVKVFNAYQDYEITGGMKDIAIYGDITYLAGASNELVGVDVSGNTFLTTLNIPLNNISAIDLSKSSDIKKVDVSGNSIKSLNTSANSALESLWVFNNELSSLDVSNNSNLTFLDCSNNTLSDLDISNNTQLVRLLCYNNQLTDLDISQNSQLSQLWVFGNQLSDTETESLVSRLRSVSNGNLWLSIVPLSNELSEAVTTKGWSLE